MKKRNDCPIIECAFLHDLLYYSNLSKHEKEKFNDNMWDEYCSRCHLKSDSKIINLDKCFYLCGGILAVVCFLILLGKLLWI